MKEKFLLIHDYTQNETSELFMAFRLDDKTYAIPASRIVEIIQLPALQVMEKMPSHILGVMNLRGTIINIIDVRKILRLPKRKLTVDHQVLIINLGTSLVGIIADSVRDVIQVEVRDIKDLPYRSEDQYVNGAYKYQDDLIALLNLDSITRELDSNNFHLTQGDLSETEVSTHAISELFPCDEASLEKLKLRALNLQSELKVDAHHRNDYNQDRFVAFSLNNETFCISLQFVKEFCKLKMLPLTPVPCVPQFIRGLVNFRGEFITIIDIKSFLNISKTPITDKTKIIVIKSSHLKVGLLVDDVFDIINIPAEKIYHSNNVKFEKNNFCLAEVLGEDKKVMSILDLESLLSDEKLNIEDAV